MQLIYIENPSLSWRFSDNSNGYQSSRFHAKTGHFCSKAFQGKTTTALLHLICYCLLLITTHNTQKYQTDADGNREKEDLSQRKML